MINIDIILLCRMPVPLCQYVILFASLFLIQYVPCILFYICLCYIVGQ